MIDLILDAGFDLVITNGDFVMSESTQQHQELLLLTNYGEWRESPAVGIGTQTWLNDEIDAANLSARIKSGFEADGMTVVSVRSTNVDSKWTVQTEAHYGS